MDTPGKLGERSVRLSITALTSLIVSVNASAGTLYSFDDAALIAFEDGGPIRGYFMKTEHADGRQLECSFGFKTAGHADKSGRYKLAAQEKNQYFQARASGHLFVAGNDWRIQLNFPSEGCKQFPWPMFSSKAAEAFTFAVTEKKPAIGIYKLNAGASYYQRSDTGFEPAATKGIFRSVVVAVEKQGDFTRIENHAWRDTDTKYSTWVRTADLEDLLGR